MAVISCALALLSGVIGAGFASGREIAHFFASHGAAALLAVIFACLTLWALFLRLPAQMERAGVRTLTALCRLRLGGRLGPLCAGLFFLLESVTAGAMLAACAELTALLLPLRHAYGLGLVLSLLLGTGLAALGLNGLAIPGAALCALLPILLVRLIALPEGEACFVPAGLPLLRAGADGVVYAALNAAMLCGTLPLLLTLKRKARQRAVQVFCLLFGALLLLGVVALSRHRQAALGQALPFVVLGQGLGKSGYVLCALSMYAAALSTLCAMLSGMMRPFPRRFGAPVAAAVALLFACCGFGTLVSRGYPVLGALCAALLGLLCTPLPETHALS